MKLYKNRNNKRDISCGYCLNDGHNKRNCPTMKKHWELNKHLTRNELHSSNITGVDITMFPSVYANYYGDSQAQQQFVAHFQYMKDRYEPKTSTKKKKRSKTKCGFCGSTAHTRRNCNKMKNFVYVLNQANKAYRSQFYDRFVDGMGLGAGALLSMRTGGMGICTSFPTDDIMFTNLKRTWSDYHSVAKMHVLVDGESWKLDMGNNLFRDPDAYDKQDERGFWECMYGTWGNVIAVTSPAPNKPTKEWFMGQTPCFEWIVKKRSQQQIMAELYRLIKHFYPHDNLRAKLGAKIYDQYYVR
jgi:hypothetical protein